MSSSDDSRDDFAMKPTVDMTVPLLNDITNEYNRFGRGGADDDWEQVYCWRGLLLSHGVLSLLGGLPGIIVGVWALVQITSYFSTSASIVSALLFIVGVVMVFGGIAHILLCILFIRYSGARDEPKQLMRCALIFSVHYFLPIVVVSLGITTAALVPSLSTTQLSANTTLSNYLSDQSAQANFDYVQRNLMCCGVEAFTDYKSIFNNLSVPVSCCNTTNPLANKTTCPEFVSNAQQVNKTGLIYSEGCVPQLQSVLQYILSVVAGASITIGVLQFLGNAMSWCLYFVYVYDYCIENTNN